MIINMLHIRKHTNIFISIERKFKVNNFSQYDEYDETYVIHESKRS